MVDPLQLPGFPSIRPVGLGAAGNPPASNDAPAIDRGARFQALLEEIEGRARSLAQAAREPLSAESLPGAVKEARTSLEDALHLSNDLLEAFRQSNAQAGRAKVQGP